MQEVADNELLREYVEQRSEKAFATLVARHINKVYSAALRHTRNPSHAQEITQAVFVILARKAAGLRPNTILSGWLYQTARMASVTFLRSEIRRARREQEAYMQSDVQHSNDPEWAQLAPILDEAMSQLGEKDRNAVVLRFFDGKSMKDVGQAISASEDATKKRVTRAVEKLRLFFAQRGVTLSSAVIGAILSANAAQAAPLNLVASSTTAALGGSAAATSTLSLVEGVLKLMAWIKLKTAVAFGTVALVTAGSATVAVNAINSPASSGVFERTSAHLVGWGEVINPDNDCMLTVTKNRLTVQIPGTDHAFMPERGRTNAPRVLQEVEGDFEIQVRVTPNFPAGARTAAKGRNPYQDAGLFVWIDEKNNLKLARAQIMVDGKPQNFFNLEFRQRGEYGTSAHGTKALVEAKSAYIRLKRTGNTIEAGVSADGKEWLYGSLPPAPMPKKLRVGLIAQQNTYSPMTVHFDEFSLKRGSY